MKRNEINIRDPFVLNYEGKYYLFGTEIPTSPKIKDAWGFWCYISEDLEEWSEPIQCFEPPKDFWATKNFWAPEVHVYHNKFYMLASFYGEGKMRATQCLVSDRPEGPYHVNGEPLTPADWMCLDGTLYIEDDVPYLVFCHEWLQTFVGEIAAVQLNDSLSAAVGEPLVLFKATDSNWSDVLEMKESNIKGYVTDGPFLKKTGDELLMFWSSFHGTEYAVGMAVSDNGKLFGNWKHLDRMLFDKDGGHGMVFQTKEGKELFVMHRPNVDELARPSFFELEKEEVGFRLREYK